MDAQNCAESVKYAGSNQIKGFVSKGWTNQLWLNIYSIFPLFPRFINPGAPPHTTENSVSPLAAGHLNLPNSHLSSPKFTQ